MAAKKMPVHQPANSNMLVQLLRPGIAAMVLMAMLWHGWPSCGGASAGSAGSRVTGAAAAAAPPMATPLLQGASTEEPPIDTAHTHVWGRPGVAPTPNCCMARTNARKQCKRHPLAGKLVCRYHHRAGCRYGLITEKCPPIAIGLDVASECGDGGATSGSEAGVSVLSEPQSEASGSVSVFVGVPPANALASGSAPSALPSDPIDKDAVWDRLWKEVHRSAAVNPNNPVFDELKHFCDFTELFREQQEGAGLAFVATPFGDMGASEEQVLAYLAWVRSHHLGKGADYKKPYDASTLLKKFGKIRVGLEQCGEVDVPAWAEVGVPHTRLVKNTIAQWSLEDLHHPAKKACKEKLSLQGHQIEDYCLSLIVQDMAGQSLSDWDLCKALVLRVQSGTNIRSGNLGDIIWSDVVCQKGTGEFGSISVLNTKRVARSVGSASKVSRVQAKVARWIDDLITGYMFKAWCARHKDHAASSDFFFPAFVNMQPVWQRHLQNAVHNQWVRECVSTLGLESNPGKLALYSTTSIRVGNVDCTEESITRFRAQRNKDCGWAKDSWVPLRHYTSDAVALAAGPLFWDKAGCDAKYMGACQTHLKEKYLALLCTQCGMPFPDGATECPCNRCKLKARYIALGSASNPKVGHSCWKQQCRHPDHVPEDAQLLLAAAWAELGCPWRVVWVPARHRFELDD